MDRIRVLIADDEEIVRESLTSVIHSDPSLRVVAAARDTQSAIDLAVSERPDVALVDVRMPGGGGPRAAREISARCPPTRVVALSAFEDRSSVLTMIQAGARSYIGKAATTEEILRAVHGAVAGASEMTPAAMNELVRAFAETVRDKHASPESEQQHRQLRRLIRRRAVDVAFQPVAELETMQVVGVEAFAHLRTRPHRSPHVWFERAAQFGLLRELELVAASGALAQLDRLPASCSLALNVFPETAASREFLELITSAEPSRVVLELSERRRNATIS